MIKLYNQVCQECSQLITNRYSTSFSMGIRLFAKELRPPIYALYGFVRFADEIVDSFHEYDKESLLFDFKKQTFEALKHKISLNPILHSFQEVVHEYDIPHSYIEAFLNSMEMDLDNSHYTTSKYNEYIYGSAEVIGLMCLKIFVNDPKEFATLESYARSLGSAFQKINFLRDFKSDFDERGRVYFPGVDYHQFSISDKQEIETDINIDFQKGYEGAMMLPSNCKKGVLLAYKYYFTLYEEIKNKSPEKILTKRIRISDFRKFLILLKLYIFRMN